MITPQTIPIGEWLPDQQELENQGAFVITNVIPEGADYKPFKDLSPVSDALPSVCRGAYTFRSSDGVIHTFAATETSLHKLDASNAFADVSKSGGYTSQNDIYWRFVNYGDRVIGVNYVSDTQSYNVLTDSEFSDLDADAPRAKSIMVLKDFVVVANTFDTVDGAVGNRVRWSGLNAPTQWTVGTNNSDYQDIQGAFGEVTGIANLRSFGVIVLERGIWRMDYTGGPFVFRFEQVSESIGSRAPNSIVSNGEAVYFYGENGFFAFDGQSTVPIGDGKVDRWFADNVDSNYLYKIVGSVYPNEKCILWQFKSVDSPDESQDKGLLYSWASNRFTLIDEGCEYVFSSLQSGFTLDSLDTLFSSIDAMTISLDSSTWSGGQRVLAGFNSLHQLCVFSGDNKPATVETGEVQLNSQGRAVLYGVKPIVDSPDVSAMIGYRDRQADNVLYSASSTPNSITEECDFTIDARYHRARLMIPAGSQWKRIRGIKPRAMQTGEL